MTIPVGRLVMAGDTALFIGHDRKSYVRTLEPGGKLETHLGVIAYDDLIGKAAYGDRLKTHLGHLVYVLTPGIDDLLSHSRHATTIIQPKDLGYIALKLGIQSGSRVIEAGTGSGGLTLWLAQIVGDSGQVISYDRTPNAPEVARRNLSRAGEAVMRRVTFKTRDIALGLDETEVDALFLDVPNPWDYLAVARAALRGGGHFGALVPTTNQVVELIGGLYAGPWFRIEVEELLLRSYKVMPARLRPDDQMVGHTGYLIFARAVNAPTSDTANATDDTPGGKISASEPAPE
ncbi:MAG: tRNA (adenine-N1)-methyltransferase [Aggregatilineales bacterium]